MSAPAGDIDHRRGFRTLKRGADILVALLLLPPLVLVALTLLVLNPLFNKGPLIYAQARMGRGCRAFPLYKFRTMRPAARILRGADDPLELDRVTRLGHVLRALRLDELPQVYNVLRGDMSLIGPRPDYFHHARRYIQSVPGYRDRHSIKPGISGLAQTEVGYVAGTEATGSKVAADLFYIRNASLRLDAWIFWRTLVIVASRKGT